MPSLKRKINRDTQPIDPISAELAQNISSAKFVEKADYEKGFAKYFDEKVKPTVKDLECVRLKTVAGLRWKKPLAYSIIAVLAVAGVLMVKIKKAIAKDILLICLLWQNHRLHWPAGYSRSRRLD